MASKIDRSTVIPLGIVVSVTVFFLYMTSSVVTKYVKLETKVETLESRYQSQATQLNNLNSQIIELNHNMVVLSQILKNLEEKIK